MADAKITITTKRCLAKELAKAPPEIEEDFFTLLEKVQGMTLAELWADKGLNFERRKQDGVWTLRLNRGWRAFCLLRTGPVIEIFGIKNPTEAHRRR